MDQVGSLNSSRDLQPIHAKNFVNRLHFVLQISKIPSQNFAFLCFCVYGVRTKQGLIINSLITLTILSSFLQFFFGETPQFLLLLTAAAHVENQRTDFFFTVRNLSSPPQPILSSAPNPIVRASFFSSTGANSLSFVHSSLYKERSFNLRYNSHLDPLLPLLHRSTCQGLGYRSKLYER
jgi:hypothetical protein